MGTPARGRSLDLLDASRRVACTERKQGYVSPPLQAINLTRPNFYGSADRTASHS
jgi:hypothetical protein